MTDSMTPTPETPEPVRPAMLKRYLMWCYGLKVCAILWLMTVVAALPVYAVAEMVCYLADVKESSESGLGSAFVILTGVIFSPYIVGTMYQRCRPWFRVDKSIEEAFRPKV